MLKNYVKSTINILARAVEITIACMAAAMMVTLMWQVFTRFVIKVPSIWTEEIARATFMYMAMLGAALGVKNSEHFGVTLFSDKLKGKVRDYYFRYIVNGIILISAIFIFIYGWEFTFTYGMTRVSPTFLWPMAYVFIAIPISAIFMMIFSLYNMFFENFSHVPVLIEEIKNNEAKM